jgi:hypothetical protein
MRNKSNVPAATLKALFGQLFTPQRIGALLRTHGVRRRRPPTVSAFELLGSLIFHVAAGPGKLSAHVKQLTGKVITDGALSQRRALLPVEVFEAMMQAALQPKADPKRHPEAFYRGLRLCGIDGTTFSVTNTPQVKKKMKKAPSRRGRAAFPKVGLAVMGELGLHNPLAAALGAEGEAEMVLAKRVLARQPERSLLISDRDYGVPALWLDLPPEGQRHQLARVKANLKRRLGERLPDGSALIEIGSGPKTRRWREVVARVQRGTSGQFPTVRLWTTLLDWKTYPARELVGL